jgi:glycosyltransferase involved in cell wall biosynthesis
MSKSDQKTLAAILTHPGSVHEIKPFIRAPKVSILMPAYNTARFVKEAIWSVIKQTYFNWELIFSDDCSTDGTWETAQAISNDTRIKFSRNDANIGLVKNRSHAYSLATGDFVCHLDSDDRLERYAIEEMILAFAQRPDVQLIYSDMSQIGESGEHHVYAASENYDSSKLYQHGWRHLGMYRRSVMEKIAGYNTQLSIGCEDGDLFMQIAEAFPSGVYRLPKVLYLYRAHGSNNSRNNKKCEDCGDRPICNYVRVWCGSVGYDPLKFAPIAGE